MKKYRINLDNNATAPLDPQISHLLIQHLQRPIGNPSSVHSFGQEARSLINEARRRTALFLQVKPQELIFTSGATEGMNMLIHGAMQHKKLGHIITSSVEHPCVIQMMREMEKWGHDVTYLSPGAWGAVLPEQVMAAINPRTSLIVLMAANNETGVKTDIHTIAKMAHQASIPFIVDGVAVLGKELFQISEGISGMCFSGHKVHAPHGIGVVFSRAHVKLPAFLKGGAQEFGYRGGTENVLGIIALGKAFELIDQELTEGAARMEKLRDLLESSLLAQLPDVSVNGMGPRVVNTTNIAFAGVDGETLLIALDQEGIAASHGSACSSGALEPSRILLNMGLPLKLARASIRFSLSRMTSQAEIEQAIPIIVRLVEHLRRTI